MVYLHVNKKREFWCSSGTTLFRPGLAAWLVAAERIAANCVIVLLTIKTHYLFHPLPALTVIAYTIIFRYLRLLKSAFGEYQLLHCLLSEPIGESLPSAPVLTFPDLVSLQTDRPSSHNGNLRPRPLTLDHRNTISFFILCSLPDCPICHAIPSAKSHQP